jgi:hypothetical protein
MVIRVLNPPETNTAAVHLYSFLPSETAFVQHLFPRGWLPGDIKIRIFCPESNG